MRKTVTPSITDPKSEADKLRRTFRAAVDCNKVLDELMKQNKSYKDVFLPEATTIRGRLQMYCEKLMFADALEYGRKAEELLWRKVYYDVIQLMKKNKKQIRPGSTLESAYKTHLSAAIGYYNHLLFRLQNEFELEVDGHIDFSLISRVSGTDIDCKRQKGALINEKLKIWALNACHRCFIYLGDIARYQQDDNCSRSNIFAQRYYYQALSLFPDIGMPFNQLGTLAGSRYYGADAAYYYLRCLCCSETFVGAQGNLERIFEKNRARYLELSQKSPRDLPPEQQRAKDIKGFLVRFLHLLELFLMPTRKTDSKGMQEQCQQLLHDFNLVMFYQPPYVTQPNQYNANSHTDAQQQYLEDDMILKLIIMCMISVYQLQQLNSKSVTAAITFSLAFFSHILNHAVIRLQCALYEMKNPHKVLQDFGVTSDSTKETNLRDLNNSNQNDSNQVEEMPSSSVQRKRLRKRRRRFRRDRGSQGSGSEKSTAAMHSDEDSDLSEAEGFAEDLSSESESDEEAVDFTQPSESSESDSDDHSLMVSQELRPGFSLFKQTGAVGGSGDSSEQTEEDFKETEKETNLNSINVLNNEFTKSLKGLPSQDFREIPDFSSDLLSESSSILKEAFAKLLPNSKLNEGDAYDAPELSAVVQGKKEVRIPPGFHTDPEARHVLDISQKIANFVIETDTETSTLATDTENSLLSELDTEATETDADSVIDRAELEERHLESVLHVITNDGLLKAIKVYCDWLISHPAVITTLAQGSSPLWTRLSVLLNFLPLESDLAKNSWVCGSNAVLEMMQESCGPTWHQTQPLMEDFHLRCFPPLINAHAKLEMDPAKQIDINPKQEALIRVCCLRKFGRNIAQMRIIPLLYDTEKAMFYGPIKPEESIDDEQAQGNMAENEAKRNQLMKDMAQLRLQAEVSELEGSLKKVDTPSLPPYLVPDTSALCDGLHLLRQLVNSARFIVVVPSCVIDHLDFLKKELSSARDAIRWLEAELKKGNRYLRAQKSHEKLSSLPQKNLKKRDRDAWRFSQIVDCCKYLAAQSKEVDPRNMVCIIQVKDKVEEVMSFRLSQQINVAHQEGIYIHQLEEFHKKWKEFWKNSKG